jgi:hypothetical protein
MHTKLTTTNKYNRAYVLTTKPLDTVKGRRDAYQKYCPVQINWDQPINKHIPKMELKPDTAKKKKITLY